MTPSAPEQHASVAELMASRARSGQHRPLLTCYDDVTGNRTELSYATLDNWAAKTANLLAEELQIAAGAGVAIAVAGHWTAAVLLLACWKLGAAAGLGTVRKVALLCCHETRLDPQRNQAPRRALLDRHDTGQVLVVGDGLAAEPLRPIPARDGLIVLADEVHAFADDYDSSEVTADTPALDLPDARLDHAALLVRGERWRARIGDGARVALALPLDHPSSAEILIAVLLGGGSLVATRSDDHVPRWERLTVERAAAVLGPAAVLAQAGTPPAQIAALNTDVV